MTPTVEDIGNTAAQPASSRPVVNTHVHLPPNFSAFENVESVVEHARSEGVVAVGTANYFDYRVYDRFARACSNAGIVPLHGIEIISLREDLQAAGVLVNDPANPGRTYLCGKGIVAFDVPGPRAAALMSAIRTASENRMAEMNARLADCAHGAGLDDVPTVASIVEDVAARNDVPAEWVSLQERHLAQALQEALFAQGPAARRGAALAALLATSVEGAAIDDPIAVQESIRSRLMKAGRPAFVPEAATSFDDAYRLVLELGGIPCYPTLADGANPICRFEDPPETLAEAILERGIHVAELIPVRNDAAVVDRYVKAFRSAGILVVGGTEHNTQRMIPLAPACRDGVPLSDFARATFWEGTCVIVAHQQQRMAGDAGYVDGGGRLAAAFPDAESRITWFRELGEGVIAAAMETAVQR